MSKVRIHELSKELGVSSKAIIEKLKEKGINASSHMSAVDNDAVDFIKNALSGEDIILNGTSFARRDNIYVKDAIKFLLLVAMYGESSQSYNISSMNQGGNFAAIDEIAEKFVNAANEITGKYSKVEKKEFTESSRFGGIILRQCPNTKFVTIFQKYNNFRTRYF